MQIDTTPNAMQIAAASNDTEYRDHDADYRGDIRWLNAAYVPTDDELAEDCTPPDIVAMHDPTARRAARQRAEDLRNAATRAHARGVRILTDVRSGLHVAQDDPESPLCWLVERDRCTCPRFGVLDRCEHVALLLSELGAIPDHEAPDCLACEGDGCPACRLLAA